MRTGYKEKAMDEERKTPAERLQDVNMAIEKILLGGQSYQIGSRKLTRGDLAILRQMQKELQAEVAAENDSPFFDDTYVAVFQGR
jgi:hypothetical protein